MGAPFPVRDALDTETEPHPWGRIQVRQGGQEHDPDVAGELAQREPVRLLWRFQQLLHAEVHGAQVLALVVEQAVRVARVLEHVDCYDAVLVGLEAELVEYCDRDASPENVLLLAWCKNYTV